MKTPNLDYIFYPKSVAVIGASSNTATVGTIYFKCFLDKGFKGNVYPVNHNCDEVLGRKCYKSIKDIPEQVDYVIISVPAEYTPRIVKECAEKNVKFCSFFTAGFSELRTEDGIRLENEIVKIARQSGMKLLGPNCLGIYCPESGLYLSEGLSPQSGNFGIIGQSGGNTTYLSKAAPLRGAFISKAVSYGNACDINECDLLDYLVNDTQTKVIGAYIEGVKDGERFKKSLRNAASAKPTIVLKGGLTDTGASVAASHTGSLAGSAAAWSSLIKQCGAIQAEDLDEMIDLAVLFQYMKPTTGRRIGIVGIGGGVSVMASDNMYSANLELPRLTPEVKERLSKITRDAGHIFTNPVDTQAMFFGPDEYGKTLKILDEWEDIDILLVHSAYDILSVNSDFWGDNGIAQAIVKMLIDATVPLNKPKAVLLHYAALDESHKLFIKHRKACMEAGLAVLTSMKSAANAIDKFTAYHKRRADIS